MIRRRITERLRQALRRQAAAVLTGPRQSGKTTLALALQAEYGAIYLDLESREDRAKLVDPLFYLRQFEDRLVILDEIHRVPEIFQDLRVLIDEGRRAGRRHGRFLLLGSASIDLLRQTGESLAGRIEYVDLAPFDVLEVVDDPRDLMRLWVRGGFPDSYLAADDDESFAFRRNFIRTYLQRDIPQFAPRIPSETLERLWTMLAHGQGGPLSASGLAANLSVSAPTVTHYVDLLVDLLLVRRLPPFHSNVRKRQVKSPRIYVRDSGLVHALLGIRDFDALAGHPVVGASWEGFVVENLLNIAGPDVTAGFYRTAGGAEIDLVLRLPGHLHPWAIEIKRGTSARPSRGFHQACADIGASRRFVVHAGRGHERIASDLEAIGLKEMAALLDTTIAS